MGKVWFLFQVLLPKCWLVYSFWERVKRCCGNETGCRMDKSTLYCGRGSQMQHVLLVLVLVILRSFPLFTKVYLLNFFFFCPPVDEITEA